MSWGLIPWSIECMRHQTRLPLRNNSFLVFLNKMTCVVVIKQKQFSFLWKKDRIDLYNPLTWRLTLFFLPSRGSSTSWLPNTRLSTPPRDSVVILRTGAPRLIQRGMCCSRCWMSWRINGTLSDPSYLGGRYSHSQRTYVPIPLPNTQDACNTHFTKHST